MDRVMVCMGCTASAPRVLSAGAHMAARLGARWYAVYVETPWNRRINRTNSAALQQNIRLAESLGATVVKVRAERPADGLVAFAQREGITHAIFDDAGRSRWKRLRWGSMIDKFLSCCAVERHDHRDAE